MPLCQACAMDMCDGDRRHRFWDCVVGRKNMAMGAEPESGDACFTRADLWLVQLPAGLAPPVWDVVCLAALSAWTCVRTRWLLWLVYARAEYKCIAYLRLLGSAAILC